MSALPTLVLLAMSCGGSGGGRGGAPTAPPAAPPPPVPALVEIASPTQGAVFQRGDVITFATKAPPADPTARIEWRSNRDGVLGEGAPLALQNLSPVTHQVIVSVDGAPQGTVDFAVQDRDAWNLQLLGSAAQGGAGIRVQGDLAAVTCDLASICNRKGLSLFDLVAPAAPRLLTTYEADDLNPRSVAISGPTVFVSSVSSGTNGFVNTVGVRILDVGDPAHPAVLADIESITEVPSVWVHEGFLYAAHRPSNFEGEIRVFDVRDPRAPMEVAQIPSPLGAPPFNLNVFDGRLHGVLLGTGVLLVADVSDPAAPVVLGTADVETTVAWPFGDGQFVLTPSGHDLLVWDVTSPMDMRSIGAYRSQPGFDPAAVIERDRRAYVTQGFAHGLEVLDLTDPARPRMIGFYDPGGPLFPTDVALTDGGLVLMLFGDELHVLTPQF